MCMSNFYKPTLKQSKKPVSSLPLLIFFIGVGTLGFFTKDILLKIKKEEPGAVKAAAIEAGNIQPTKNSINDQNTTLISLTEPQNNIIATTEPPKIIVSATEPTKKPLEEKKNDENKDSKDDDAAIDTTNQVFYGRGTPNNKIGMYVHNKTEDITAAAKLVNSNGGKWGYVLLTMEVNDRNVSNWQSMFDAASKAKLIPIVQLFNNNICNPDKLDFKGLAETLNKVKWPSKNRYISVFNEINAKDYWCQRLAPEEYAKSLNNAIKAFKAKSEDFFIMPGAFNSSARTQDRYLSEDTYLIRMNQAVPGIFKKIDGWATHSYPQPNFSGDINNLPAGYSDRDTIINYRWEMQLLKNNFGVSGLPIFITETGWLHREGQDKCEQYSQSGLLSANTTSARFKDAFLNYWMKDPRIVAITPFIFRSDDPCAEGFAWQKKDGAWYPQAQMLMNIPKTAGTSQ